MARQGKVSWGRTAEVLLIKREQGQINAQIRDKEVRLIDADGTMVGVVPGRDALVRAKELDMDLVKISPNANPPVCKIMDYGKFLYERAKKEKEAKKRQTVVELKEIRLSSKIEEHDFAFKAKNAQKFLEEGDKVRVFVRFRGREMNYAIRGREVLLKFADTIQEYGKVERAPMMEGRSMSMILVSNKAKT